MKVRKSLIGISTLIFAISPSIGAGEALPEESKKTAVTLEEKLHPAYSEVDKKFEVDDKEYVIIVDGKDQKLYLVSEGQPNDGKVDIHKDYVISTGAGGFGYESGKRKTPLGIHRIKKKIGKGVPAGTSFKGRKIIDDNHPFAGKITSRIMWLEGKEYENRRSYSRYIYIHGNNKEELIGWRFSDGCIMLKNKDVIELYNFVKEGKTGTYVNIKKEL